MGIEVRQVVDDSSVPESMFTKPSAFCPHPGLWTAPDNQATEREVSELLAAFVRAIQPELVLETGTHEGFTTVAIAEALARNGHGRLVSIEANSDLASRAADRLSRHGVTCVEVINSSSLEYTPDAAIDLAWLDSGGGFVRYEELLRFTPFFSEGAVIGIHDTAPHQGDIPAVIEALTTSGRFQAITLRTPRGVTFGQFIRKASLNG